MLVLENPVWDGRGSACLRQQSPLHALALMETLADAFLTVVQRLTHHQRPLQTVQKITPLSCRQGVLPVHFSQCPAQEEVIANAVGEHRHPRQQAVGQSPRIGLQPERITG